MFKDLYKKANDAIPTEDAYLRVMEKVNAEPAKTKYSYGKYAALAACFILTISLFPVYQQAMQKREDPFVPITAENMPNPNINQEGNPEAVENVDTPSDPVVEKVTPAPYVPPVTEPKQPTRPKTVYVKNQGIPENVGVATARFSLGEVVTEDAYYQYLGKDVCKNIVLPEGVTDQSEKEQMLTLTEGEDFNDKWSFYFGGDEATIFITTTKSIENIENTINNEEYTKSNILDTDVVIFEDEESRVACFSSEDIGYTVSSYGVSDKDFENLLTSLIK